VKHSNGEGQSWFDCAPANTFDETQATEACAAFTGDASQCHALSCGGSASVCSDGSLQACDCWIYAAPDGGRVKENPAGNCACKGNSNSASWN
jgi:hypothetical protein